MKIAHISSSHSLFLSFMNLKHTPDGATQNFQPQTVLRLHILGLPLPIWVLAFILVAIFLTVMVHIVKKWTSDYYAVYWSDDELAEFEERIHDGMQEDQNGQVVFDALLWNKSKQDEEEKSKSKRSRRQKQQGMAMARLLAQSHGNQVMMVPDLGRNNEYPIKV